ncbi:PDZ and LIM domain protein 5 isoform X2 [Bufo bufo]|uniref:PDZ and LIM domain protein 5 isoform X2 n=1 Tax=Bufo bufo TaxID=8384 RepID=UPI001ABEB0B8|nr:PDZ and LIM domain protein 5 isoform X2 [Bufo bufo]
MSNFSVSLVGPSPWGFRLQGGKDFNMPLTISRLNDGGKAAKANIGIGDVVLSIDGMSTDGMTHLEAQNKIKACAGSLHLTLQKAVAIQNTPNPPQTEAPKEIIKPVPIATPIPAVPKVTTAASVAFNKAPRPFGAPSPSKPASIPSPSSAFTPATQASAQPSAFSLLAAVNPPAATTTGLHASYKPYTDGQAPMTKPAVTNIPRQPASYSPVNQHSNNDAANVQRRGQNLGDKSQNGPPRQHILDVETDFHHTPTFSDASKKRLVDNTEDWHPRTGTSQSRSFRILAQMTGTENLTEPEPETVDRNKKSQVINGDISMSAGLPIITDSHAIPVDVAMCTTSTQTEDVLSTSEPPTVNPSSLRSEPTSLEKSGNEEILPVSSFTTSLEKTSVDPGPSNNPRERALFDNPLESLPKCAPFPPATVRTLNVISQVATISKTASVYMRSTMIVPSPVVETTYAEIPVGNGMSVEIGLREKCTVSTQTYDPPAPQQSWTSCAAEPLASKENSPPKTLSRPVSIGNSGRQTSAEHASSFSSHITLAQTSSSAKKPLMENPLDQLPKSAPCPPLLAPLTEQNSKRKTHAVAAVSAVVGAQARLSDPFVYRSLLDALIIEPVIRQPVPSSKLGRRSTGLIGSEPFMSESLEPAPVTRTAGASSKIMPASYNPTPSAYKPSSSTTAAKPGGWQPGPSTGRVSSAPSTVKPATNNKPFVPPPVDDQDTLFQRAEHIPAGTRTPMCAKCNLVIRGPFLLALGKSWHPEEFNCAHCKKSMVEMGFAEEKGFLYCEICYEKFFAPDCARCQRKILGEIINALKQTWHVSCFVCVACQKPIHNSVFHLEDGDPYCEMDYYSLFGTMCHGCEFPIEAGDRFLEALGHTWHNTCFVCSVCCESLEGQTFFSKKDKPLCKKHAHAVNI